MRFTYFASIAMIAGIGWSCSETPVVDIVPVASVALQPDAATIYIADTVDLNATLEDDRGNTLSGRSVSWTSDDQQIATVNDQGLVIGVAAGQTNIVATSEGVRGTAAITIQARPIILVDPDSAVFTIVRGSAAPVMLDITNTGGSPLTGLTASVDYGLGTAGWLDASLSAATAPATLTLAPAPDNLAAGEYDALVRVSAPDAANSPFSIRIRLDVLSPVPAHIQINGGDGQAAPAATTLPDPLTVLVTDSNDDPLPGVAVTFRIASGGGSLAGNAPVFTNANGIATAPGWTLGPAVGTNTVEATADGLPVDTVTFTATATTGAASKLAITTQPSVSASSGSVFARQPVIQLQDPTGNPVGQAGVTVTAAIASGAGILNGTPTAVTSAAGTATFTDLAINGPVGDRTIEFTAPGFTPVTSSTISITASAGTQLAMVTQPSATAPSGVAFDRQPAVQLQDAGGNSVAQAGVLVTAAIESGGGTLDGTVSTTTNASGLATFTDLTITGIIGDRTLRFSASGITAAVSSPVAITVGEASRLAIATQPPATAASGAVFSQQPAVQIQDASGNAVAEAGVEITAAIESGGGTLDGTLTANTDAAGVATFADLGITGVIGDRTLSFTATGLTAVTSSAVAISAGAASRLAITTQPSATATSGVAFVQQPAVQLQDASGNVVGQAGIVITAAIVTGAGTLGGTLTAMTNASGLATFTNLGITGVVGGRTLTFSAPGMTAATSGTVTITPGAASQLVIATPPSATAPSGVAFGQQPAVQLQDASGNLVEQAGVVVTAAIATGAGTLNGPLTAATDEAGLATFADLGITGVIGDRTFSFTATGLTAVTSGTVTITAGAASQLAITTPPSATAASGVEFEQQPAVQLQDASGNAVAQAGTVITAAIATGDGTLDGTATATTNPSGLATFTDLGITGEAGDRTLNFSADALTGVNSGTVTITAAAAPAAQSSIVGPDGTVGVAGENTVTGQLRGAR